MGALAKLWTWTGHSFIPVAVGWAVFARGGLDSAAPSIGVLVSRGYWGLLMTLAAACVLIFAGALYVRAAKRNGLGIVVPPNTTFESGEERSLPISWGTVIIFGLAVVAGLAVFSARYADSRIHAWDDVRPLREEFLASRLTAHERGCSHQPCFAVGPRVDGAGKSLPGVNEYILYLTDGALLAAALLVMLGLAYMLFVGLQRTRTPRFEL